jgi:hypothetical protein
LTPAILKVTQAPVTPDSIVLTERRVVAQYVTVLVVLRTREVLGWKPAKLRFFPVLLTPSEKCRDTTLN